MTTNKVSFREKLSAWLSDEEGALERTMAATQQQAAGPDVDELTPAEIRWAQEEREEEERIAAAMDKWTEDQGSKAARMVYNVMCVLICVTLIGLLLFTVTEMPKFGSPDHPINNEVSARYIEKGLQETGAVNIVTGMILDYRAFDTLGESSVLFTAVHKIPTKAQSLPPLLPKIMPSACACASCCLMKATLLSNSYA